MIEAPASTSFILLPQVPWADEPTSLLPPKGEFESAGLYDSGFRTDCQVQSISALGATLHGHTSFALGRHLTLELATGQRPAGSIVWVRDSACGLGFKQPIDVLALINRNLLNQPRERRRMPRVELRCAAWLKDRDELFTVTLRNISAGGLQLEGEVLPSVGSDVTLYLEGLNVPSGELIWQRSKLAGIRLRQELSWALIMPWLRNLLRNQASQA